nr:NADH dehydrogenase subunit 3 [Brachyponera chinensis]
MILMMLIFITSYLISILFFFMNFIFSKKMFKNREKLSSFECGFDPMSNIRIPFSIQFFMISLMFLIFDIEISILIPLIFLLKKFNIFMILTSSIFMIILILSIYFEYIENMIEWKL